VVFLLICLSSYLVQPVTASQGFHYEMTVGISKVEVQPEIPYVELQYLHFRTEIYNETPFQWFWLGSADWGWSAQSYNHTITFDNGRVDRFQIANISLSWAEGQSRKWNLFRVNDYTYSFGIIVAFPINVTFPMVFVSASMKPELEDQWTHMEDWERFGSPPSNTTLSEWGLDPDRFWRTTGAGEYKTYYLYKIWLSKPKSFQDRVGWTYTIPAILLGVVLAASVYPAARRKLHIRHLLTLYSGTAFFCMPFLISYLQLGLGPMSDTERLFYFDTYLAAALAIGSLLILGWSKDKRASQSQFEAQQKTIEQMKQRIEELVVQTERLIQADNLRRRKKRTKRR